MKDSAARVQVIAAVRISFEIRIAAMPYPKNSLISRLLWFAFFALPGCMVQAQEESGLRPGPHKVGFRQQWHFDYGRTYQMKLKDGSSYAPGKAARPVLMNLWYPALPTTGGKAMPRSAYLEFVKGSPKVKSWLRAFQTYNLGVICQEIMQTPEKDLTLTQRQAWQRYLATPTSCLPNAQSASGKFPLIFYHQGYGSSVEDNNEFCEYMASWGYVVVNGSYLAADGQSFNIDSRIGSAGDVNYLMNYLHTKPYVDWTKVGFVGHSGGAHTALKYRAMQSGIVDAIVCLDTTQDYYSLADPRWRFIKEDLQPNIDKMVGPIMMVANPHAFFALADLFTKADRTYFTLRLDHNEFISQGVQMLRVAATLALPAKQPEAKQSYRQVARNYARLCEFTRLYFEEKLKGQSAAFNQAKRTYSATRPGTDMPHVEVLPQGVPKPPEFNEAAGFAPTPRQLRPLLAKVGAVRTAELFRAAYSKDKTAPVYEQVFAYALVYQLMKEGKAEDAKAIYAAYKEIGVESSQTFMSQAWFGDVSKNYPFAEECLTMLLTFEPDHAEGKKMLDDIRKKMSK